jgi:hypothetical protein
LKNIKPKITVLACTWDPSVTCVAGTVLNQIEKTGLFELLLGERGVAPAIFLFDSFTVVSNINIKRTTLK